MARIPSISYPLHTLPQLIQCGLCVHGTRAVETFRQRGLWSLHLYHYPGAILLRGRVFEFAQGWASLIPPDEEVSWQFPNHAPHYYAHFRAVSKSRETASLPLLRDLGRDWVRFDRDIEELVRFFPKNELRARVRLWDLLHQYAAGQEPGETDSSFHPHVQIALSIIRNAFSGKLVVGQMARQMGVSHNQLTLLFQKQFGCGVREYIRRERVGKACELLSRSRLPVKSIAIECGFPDLQHFNKVIRSYTGHSPRHIRAGPISDS